MCNTKYDENEKIWTGPESKAIFNENLSAGEMILYMLRSKNPQDIMQISDSENITMTYGSVLTSGIRIAQHLKRKGLTCDDVVGIFAPNCSLITSVVLAALFNGNPFQPLSCTFEISLMKHIYSFVQPKVIFCDGNFYDKLKEATEEFKPLIYTLCNHLAHVAKVEDLLEPTDSEHFFRAEALKYGPNQTIAIMTSSGTTGLPKPVCINNKINGTEFEFLDGSFTSFSTSCIDWSTGLISLMAVLYKGGKHIFTTKPLTPEYLLELIVKYKINFLVTNPDFMLKLSLLPNYSKDTMKSIKLIFMTGAFCSAANLKRIRSSLTRGYLLYSYGSTEFGGIAANLSEEYKVNSLGTLVGNVQLKIVDPATGERLGPHQIGEICARHTAVSQRWRGYYRNPEATKISMDSENFIHTGDLGYMDNEHYLHLTGRCKDIMKYLGFQYSPQVIEDVIMEIPDVIDVCVFGVYDEIKYDVPAAAVIKRQDSSLSGQEIMDYVRSKSEMPQKQIHYGVFFVKELLRNRNGELLRDEVRDFCLAMQDANKQE